MGDLHQNNGIHLVLTKLIQVFRDMYWAHNVTKIAQQIKRQCRACNLGKDTIRTASYSGKHCNTQPWQLLALDTMGPLPSYNGYKYVVTFVDTCTLYLVAIHTKDHTEATVAQLLMDHFGLPLALQSVPEFTGQVWKGFTQLCGT